MAGGREHGREVAYSRYVGCFFGQGYQLSMGYFSVVGGAAFYSSEDDYRFYSTVGRRLGVYFWFLFVSIGEARYVVCVQGCFFMVLFY